MKSLGVRADWDYAVVLTSQCSFRNAAPLLLGLLSAWAHLTLDHPEHEGADVDQCPQLRALTFCHLASKGSSHSRQHQNSSSCEWDQFQAKYTGQNCLGLPQS